MRDGFIQKLRTLLKKVVCVGLRTHSNDGHSKDPELESDENNILTLGVIETMQSSIIRNIIP
jgi:hypothetical protein